MPYNRRTRAIQRPQLSAELKNISSGGFVHIESVSIKGGLLKGMKLDLSSQLNVVIGGRGTGKTSLLELIRFCMGAASISEAAGRAATEQAIGVLGDGEVTVTLLEGGTRIEVKRSTLDAAPRTTGQFLPPLAFSQSEIEQIGLEGASRLRLIDGFASGTAARRKERESHAAKIKSLTVEISAVRSEVREFQDRLQVLPQLEGELVTLKAQQTALSAGSANVALELSEIQLRTPMLESVTLQADAFDAAKGILFEWLESLESIVQGSDLDPWPAQSGVPDALTNARAEIKKIQESIGAGQKRLKTEIDGVDLILKGLLTTKATIGNEIRALRQQVEEKQKGAGTIARRIGEVSQQVTNLVTIKATVDKRVERLGMLIATREGELNALDLLRADRFEKRKDICDKLNERLGPRIKISLTKATAVDAYLSAILAALRGSGLKYNELAPRIAEAASPRELIQLVEANDYTAIADIVGVSEDRARRIVDSITASACADILSVDLEDETRFSLLDGSEYKTSDFLSTGQRCTVVLPIVLQHSQRVILLDQPEDHLDNAFIVATLIKAVSGAANTGQRIIATHNANIPVLGDAKAVFVLDSDGTRCFVRSRGNLNQSDIVTAISDWMEGGKEAFDKRAAFYDAHDLA